MAYKNKIIMTNPDDSIYSMKIDRSPKYTWEREKCDITTGFTKREIVLKDFMCALMELDTTFIHSEETIARKANSYATAYFNELNKQQ